MTHLEFITFSRIISTALELRDYVDIILLLSHIWASFLRRFGESLAVSLDISKAIDRVWHHIPITKLQTSGIPDRLCTLIYSFLADRVISVRVDGHISYPHPINSGVLQGSILSRTLILLFINDLLSSTSNSTYSHANDSTIHISSEFRVPPSRDILERARQMTAESTSVDLDSILRW